jgi:hypothetical protein
MQLEERRRWQMNYRLIYCLYTLSADAIFDDLIDVDITPLNANTDDLFSFSGRKCTIKMPYDASAKDAFYNDDHPNELYPEYVAGYFKLFKDNEQIFVGMAKVTFIDIDEQNAEIQFRISDALDIWIDLAKSKNFDVKNTEQKAIHMRSSTGDYTLANFIEELIVGFPEEMRTILLYNFDPFPVNDIKINFAKYNDDWLQWTGLAPAIDDPVAEEYWDVENTYGTLLVRFQWYANGGWSWDTGGGIWRITRFMVFTDDPNGLWNETGFYGQVRYWMADIDTNNQFQIVSEITGNSKPIVSKDLLPAKLMRLKLYPKSMESEVYAANFPINPPTSIVTENFTIVQRNWAEFYYSGDIQLNPITLNPGSYNYARVVKAALIANRLTMYSAPSAIVIRQHIASLIDGHEAIPLTDDDISHLTISGSLGQIDLSDMNEINAGYLIPALDKAYSDLLGSLRKQIRFSLKTHIANTIGLLDKISIDGKVYFVTSIGHPNDNGTTEIIAIGER